MKSISLRLPYKMSNSDKEALKGNTGSITQLLINTAVKGAYPGNMPNDASRIWAGIQEALFDPKRVTLDLDDTQFGWLKDIMGKAEFPPMLASWVWTFRNHLDEVKSKKSDASSQ